MNFLTQHLKDSRTSYIEHFKFAVYASILLQYAAIASLIHSIFPFFFKGTSASIVIKLYKQRLVNHPNPLYQEWIHNVDNNKKDSEE